MKIEQAFSGMMVLQASYPNMAKLDERSVETYARAIVDLDWNDFVRGCDTVIKANKFFPSIAELREAAEAIQRKRLEEREHDEREKRMLVGKGQDALLDPNSKVNSKIVGPQHQKFLNMISGKIVLPEPEWTKGKATKPNRAMPLCDIMPNKEKPNVPEVRNETVRQRGGDVLPKASPSVRVLPDGEVPVLVSRDDRASSQRTTDDFQKW